MWSEGNAATPARRTEHRTKGSKGRPQSQRFPQEPAGETNNRSQGEISEATTKLAMSGGGAGRP